MIKDKFSQYVYSEQDIFNMLMQGINFNNKSFLVDGISDVDDINETLHSNSLLNVEYTDTSLEEYDKNNQKNWYMPSEYKEMDIAEYILSLCNTDEELQRCGHELIMYQERNLFNLLTYLKYLVDVMKKNNIIWGVGRGSSVSSYVLYKLEVHRIDSMYYKLDVSEFLR